MKKSALAIVPILCVSLCSSAFAAFPRVVAEEDLSAYITLGEYKGIGIEKSVVPVTEEDIDLYIENEVSRTTEEITEGTVGMGDTAVIDYVGKKDGVEFEGGSAQGYPLEIGSGTFIPGFEEGVEGMAVGETKDITLTFPENYHAEELAGAETVFTVTVNSIRRVPELSDAWVAKNTDFGTIEEYREGVREQLTKQAEEDADIQVANDAFQTVWEATEIREYPEDLLEDGRAFMDKYTESYASMYGMEKDAFLEASGYTQESYEAMVEEYAQNRAGQFLVIQGIIDAEGLDLEDDVTQEIIDKMLEDYEVESIDELRETYGDKEVNASIALERVQRFLVENARITVVTPEETADQDVSLGSDVGDADMEAEMAGVDETEDSADTEETETAEDVTEEETPETEDTADEEAEG